MKNQFALLLFLGVNLLFLGSCSKQLDVKPDQLFSGDSAYQNFTGYKQGLAKVYGSFAMTGNLGPAGEGDIQGLDEGTSDFLRLFWKAQTLSTDESIVGWNDPGIQDFHAMNWTASNPMLGGLYNRIFYHVSVCNEFMFQSDESKVTPRVKNSEDRGEIKFFKAEARFLRAFQYWVAMDLFGNVPNKIDDVTVGGTAPKQIKRADLFSKVESELLAVQNELKDPKTNEYGRVDKAAAWALLARLYLNAGTYKPGENRNTDAITYAKKVIDAGYTLEGNYGDLFLADNNTRRNEVILSINYDGVKTRNWGGTTFLISASVGGAIKPGDYGITGGWGGIRTTPQFADLFPADKSDKRFKFEGPKKAIDVVTTFTDGLGGGKFRNVKADGTNGQDKVQSDVDFPLFRLAEMYLIYSEAVLRGGAGGDQGTALQYINALRTRAYGNETGNVSAIDLPFILNERGRELYYEGFRRTDLIRFNLFTTDAYLWAWKGGQKDGSSVAEFRSLYPLPSSDVAANTNLKQNPGY